MTKQPKLLTIFGKDLDILLQKAGQLSLREYADECSVNYKYISQLRTMENRRPGRLYVDLLRPFTRMKVINISESQLLSLRHRGKPLTFHECKLIFSDLPEQEILESIRQTARLKEGTLTEPSWENFNFTEGTSRNLEPTEKAFVYQRVFVGREKELQQLHVAFDSAIAGHGCLTMVIGEPGSGKSALCQKLSEYVTAHGGRTLIGSSYEKGLASIPYMAFVEPIRDYVKSLGFEILNGESSFFIASLARIVPEIRDHLNIKLGTPRDPAEERYRLLQAVSGFFKQVTIKQPLLLILEDLHNADKDTLNMLVHVVRQLREYRLLIVGTYRDVEVDRNDSFSMLLSELSRFSAYNTLNLHKLNENETKRVMEAITREKIVESLAIELHRQTEGNPLFVQELVRFLQEEGFFIKKQGHLLPGKGILSDIPIPSSLGNAIGSRLSSLGLECNKVLAIASVIGIEFDLETLIKVAEMSESTLITVLQKAIHLSVLEEHTDLGIVRYRFKHALYRQVLYDGMIAPERNKLHGKVAHWLEILHGKNIDTYAELTYHFARSNNYADMARAIYYGETAANNAIGVYAYNEAIQLLDLVIKIQNALNPGDKTKIPNLLLSLGNALIHAGEVNRFLEIEAPKAWLISQDTDDVSFASKICQQVMWAYFSRSLANAWVTSEAALWAERATGFAKADTIARARADAALGAVRCATDFLNEGVPLLSKALKTALEKNDKDTLWWVAALWLLYAASPQHSE